MWPWLWVAGGLIAVCLVDLQPTRCVAGCTVVPASVRPALRRGRVALKVAALLAAAVSAAHGTAPFKVCFELIYYPACSLTGHVRHVLLASLPHARPDVVLLMMFRLARFKGQMRPNSIVFVATQQRGLSHGRGAHERDATERHMALDSVTWEITRNESFPEFEALDLCERLRAKMLERSCRAARCELERLLPRDHGLPESTLCVLARWKATGDMPAIEL